MTQLLVPDPVHSPPSSILRVTSPSSFCLIPFLCSFVGLLPKCLAIMNSDHLLKKLADSEVIIELPINPPHPC